MAETFRMSRLPEGLEWLARSMRPDEAVHALAEQYREGARVFVHLMKPGHRPGVLDGSYMGYGEDLGSAWEDALLRYEETRP